MKTVSIVAILLLCLTLCGCDPLRIEDDGRLRVGMITDITGLNDEGFNQSGWEGLQRCEREGWASVRYVESLHASDYAASLDILYDEGNDLIVSLGSMTAADTYQAARLNPDTMYAVLDVHFVTLPPNLVCLYFREQEPSFLVGYIAGRMTRTGHVGIVGPMHFDIIARYINGFRAGVAFAGAQMGRPLQVSLQYVGNFNDIAKGKAIATSLYQSGADVLFHVAGFAGLGVIEAAREMNRWVIGVDRDQSHLAPDQMLTSAMKYVDRGIHRIARMLADGELTGGIAIVGSLENGMLGYAPTTHNLVPSDILADTDAVAGQIIRGEIVPPATDEEYFAFMKNLPHTTADAQP